MSLVGKLARWHSYGDVFGALSRVMGQAAASNPERSELKPFAYGDDFVMLELEIINPPSMEGRKAWVALYNDDVTDLLLKLREYAIHLRNKPIQPTFATTDDDGNEIK